MGTTSKKISVILTLLMCYLSSAQGTLEEYKKANVLDSLFKNKVINSPKEFHWIGNELLWYVNNTRNGKEYFLVDSKEGKQSLAFDHNRLAASLSKVLGRETSSNQLPIDNLEFNKELSEFVFTTDSLKLSCDLKTYQLNKIKGGYKKDLNKKEYWGDDFDELANKPVASPDSVYTGYIKNYNLYIQNSTSVHLK